MIDLNKGGRLATYIEPSVDGVFRRDTGLIVNKNIFIHRNQNLNSNLVISLELYFIHFLIQS